MIGIAIPVNPLSFGVALIAQRNEVRRGIRFIVAVNAECSKWLDVMNVKCSAVVMSGYAAVTTRLVSRADNSLRRTPRWTVIGGASTFPKDVLFSRSVACKCNALALLGAVAPPFALTGLDRKDGLAFGTRECFRGRKQRVSTKLLALVGMEVASFIYRLPVTEATRRAKPSPCHRRSEIKSGSALLANSSCARLSESGYLPSDVCLGRARKGAVLTRHRPVVIKRFATIGALACRYPRTLVRRIGIHTLEFIPKPA